MKTYPTLYHALMAASLQTNDDEDWVDVALREADRDRRCYSAVSGPDIIPPDLGMVDPETLEPEAEWPFIPADEERAS